MIPYYIEVIENSKVESIRSSMNILDLNIFIDKIAEIMFNYNKRYSSFNNFYNNKTVNVYFFYENLWQEFNFHNHIHLIFDKYTSLVNQHNGHNNITYELINDDEYTLYFDACCTYKPIHISSGVVLYKNNQEIWQDSIIINENATINYAMYEGLIIGLRKALELNIKNIIIKSSNDLVIKQMNGFFKVKSENIKNNYILAKNIEKEFNYIIFIHCTKDENKRANDLAQIRF